MWGFTKVPTTVSAEYEPGFIALARANLYLSGTRLMARVRP